MVKHHEQSTLESVYLGLWRREIVSMMAGQRHGHRNGYKLTHDLQRRLSAHCDLLESFETSKPIPSDTPPEQGHTSLSSPNSSCNLGPNIQTCESKEAILIQSTRAWHLAPLFQAHCRQVPPSRVSFLFA